MIVELVSNNKNQMSVSPAHDNLYLWLSKGPPLGECARMEHLYWVPADVCMRNFDMTDAKSR